MATLIELGRLSPTMEEGVLSKWRKNEGEKVAPGDILAEVETDKAAMEMESFDEGTLLKRLIPEGATLKVGAPVAIIGKPGEDIAAVEKEAQDKLRALASGAPAPAPKAPPPPPKVAAPARAEEKGTVPFSETARPPSAPRP